MLGLIVLLVVVALCGGLYYIFRVFNGPDGERYQRQRMQGPFVPVSEADPKSKNDQRASERGDG